MVCLYGCVGQLGSDGGVSSKVERKSQGVCRCTGQGWGVTVWMHGVLGLGAVLYPYACAVSQGVAWDVCI